MKVLVLGGTGAMGKHLVARLAAQSAEALVTSRQAIQSNGSIRYAHGNARIVDYLRTLLVDKWDAIIDFMVYKTTEFEKRVELLLGATAQYFFISSSRVYADSSTPITEESPRLLDVSNDMDFLATDGYALAKARQEDILLRSGNTNWTIIRPYITYAENRLQLGVFEKEEWLYRALKGRSILFSRDICQKHTTMTYGADIAKAIIALIGKQDALGQVFLATSDRTIAWREILEVYLDVLERHLGTRPRILLQDIEPFTQCCQGFHQIQYDRLYDRSFNNNKLARHVDVSQFTTPEAGLRKCLESFLDKPEFGHINWSCEAIKDRQTRESALLNEIPSIKDKARYLKHRYF